MKKQILIVGMVILLICVGLSGCNQQSSNGNSNNPQSSGNPNIPQSSSVQISNIKVTTKWNDGYYNGKRGQADGFYHDYPTGMSAYYEITGDVKNIAGKPIDSVSITVKYYDNSNNYLDSSTAYVSTLYLEETKSFSSTLYASNYFDHISDYKIEITNVQIHQ